eukprot:jgi/Tetstr1/466595/TSEL_011083.t1
MTELVRSWDDARTEAVYAGHARQRRRTDAVLFAALLVGTADTVRGGVGGGRRGEERLTEERAVVGNMKEAYVSVLAPSQLGVGITAGDSVLIHGVRLIAEKLGPRAVIVHTNLRNACNEAWRGTIIQRHIDCSPLDHVIPALLAFLSTDPFLLVDDRSAPLRPEDGGQQGASLATTSFSVAIHPKASVGLGVRLGKMHAHGADMAATRREAPADIEWPELDGHHRGIPGPQRAARIAMISQGGYWLRNCLPSEVDAFAEAVDATVLTTV